MSGYILVIYGSVFPLSEKKKHEEALLDLVDSGKMRLTYSGNGNDVCYVGVDLSTIRQYSYPADGYEKHDFEPTEEQKAEAVEMVNKVPEAIREMMTPIGRYVIPAP